MLIQIAAGDQFARGAHELAARAHRYGVRTTVKVYPINSHNFQSFWSFLPEATHALRDAGQFIRDCSDAASATLSS
jgi:epsilon-lactone hydrolase